MMRQLLLLIPLVLFAAACDDDPVATPDAAARDTLNSADQTTADAITGTDGPIADAPGADAVSADSAAADTSVADGPAADAGAPTKTPCGNSLQCNSTTEVCVVNQAQLKTYVCKAVPTGCETKRTCACLGASVCTGIFTMCTNNSASNTVNCECPNC